MKNLGPIIAILTLAACGGTGPDDDKVIEIAKQQIRSGLASQVGMNPSQKDKTLDDVINKSKFSVSEPCQSHPQMPQVYICGVYAKVALPISLEYKDNEVNMPVAVVKSKNGDWVDMTKCEGEFQPEC